MSNYTLKEHLTIHDTGCDYGTLEAMTKKLTSIETFFMPQDLVFQCELTLVADGKKYTFSGQQPTDEFYHLINAMAEAKSVDLIGFYDYRFDDWFPEAQPAAPYCVANLFRSVDAQSPDGVFYSLYCTSDIDTNTGMISAYGQKDNRTYCGTPAYHSIAELPETGIWFTPVPAVTYDAHDIASTDLQQITNICKELCTMSSGDLLQTGENEIHFSLEHLKLKSRADLEHYISLCHQLMVLTNGDCTVWEEFADLSAADPRMLQIDIQPDGTAKYQLMEL